MPCPALQFGAQLSSRRIARQDRYLAHHAHYPSNQVEGCTQLLGRITTSARGNSRPVRRIPLVAPAERPPTATPFTHLRVALPAERGRSRQICAVKASAPYPSQEEVDFAKTSP